MNSLTPIQTINRSHERIDYYALTVAGRCITIRICTNAISRKAIYRCIKGYQRKPTQPRGIALGNLH